MNKPTYIGWRPGYHSKISAEVAYNEIERLKKSNGGSVDPEILVEKARSKNNPLHPEIFDKAESDAAEAYYLRRAGEVLRAIQVTVKEGPAEPVRAFTPVIMDSAPDASEEEEDCPSSKMEWVSLEDAMKDPLKRKQVLARALAELQSLRKKYANLKELAGVWEAVDKV